MSQTYDFPPKLSPPVYITIFHAPIFAFISLSLKPIASKRNVLCIIIFVQALIPFIYHGRHEPLMHLNIAVLTILYTSKMMIWMKKNYQSSIDSKIKIPSFTASLFNLRPNAVTIPDESKYQRYIDSIKVTDINQVIINHTIKAIIKYVILDLIVEYLRINKPEFSERSYGLRVLDYLRTGRLFIETYTFFYCILFIILVIIAVSISWNITCIIFGIILKPLLSDNVDKNRKREESKSFKTKLKEWLIISIFYTKPLMDKPYFSTGPRDLWSNQWHQIFYQIFIEIGYLPVRNYFKHDITLGRILGTCSVFLLSGLCHDYVAIVTFSHFSLDYTSFFLFHGLLLILWEAVEVKILGRGKDFKDSMGIKVFKMALFLPIAIFTVPLFAEPYVKGLNFYSNLNIYTNLTIWINKNFYAI
ncbi:14734_t:CDS:1 [Dentiscutata erythropus]|uniref:14734_t:CDS:1 n=1 Tax=Dentiscutata erythropus TaxID=1348616 RepID=A0A9N9GL77_9GLOM|nr:14734_t:CDS:1 [Dentiscutata erythropus]